jgi:CelD/BcsL family acetyltransferase involved in cellulose biosynthesis
VSEPELLVECVRPVGDAIPHAATLLRLNERSPRPSPFFTPEYIRTYLAHNERHSRDQVEPFVLLARRRKSREIIGALPLKRVWDRSHIVPFRRIEFLVASEVDMPPLLAAPGEQLPAARAILRTLARSLHRASVVELIHQPSRSPLYQATDAVRAPWADVRNSKGMPISSIRPQYDDFGAYFHALSHKMRSNVSRLARRLFAQGHLTYLTSSAPAATADMLEVYLDVEDRSWKVGTDASLRRHPVRVEMYRKLLRHSERVRYHVDVLLLKGMPIASQVSMQFHRTLFTMETCYDEAYGDYGPGNLMLLLAIRRAVELRVDEMSLHGHFEYYKHRWLAETLETRDVRILRKGSVPHVRALAGAVLRRVRGESERKLGIPLGKPAGSGEDRCQKAPPQSVALAAKLSSHPMVTRLDDAVLRALLPFPTTS